MSAENSIGNMQFAPLRSLDDFLLESARFQLPNFGDLEKWGNRVTKNLLYYQTNYLILAGAIFLLIGLVHPGKVLLGLTISGALVYILTHFFSPNSVSGQQPNKWVVLGALLGVSYLILYMMDAVLIVLFAILLPFCTAFVHASLRLRSLKNKVTNTLEVVGLKHSPMGKFLEAMGLMPDSF